MDFTKMKINPYIFLGIGSNPRIRYKISNGYAVKEKLGIKGWVTENRVPLSGATFDPKKNMPFSDFGDIQITAQNGTTQLWKNVNNISKLVEIFENGGVVDDIIQKEQKEDRSNYPTDISFDEQVVSIPPLPDIFDRPLWLATNTKVGGCPEWKAKVGSWVNKGDTICTFTIKTKKLFGAEYDLDLKSPVNGLILKEYNFMSWNNGIKGESPYQNFRKKENIFVIPEIILAVPRGENVPSTTRSLLIEFSQGLRTHKNRIFFTEEEFKNSQRFTEEEVDAAIDFMLDAPLLRFPILEYKDYFDTVEGKASPELVKALRKLEK